jgi:hypothetical protein
MEHKFKVGDKVIYALKNGYKGILKDFVGKETTLESFDGMYFITSEAYLVKPEDIEPIPINHAEKTLNTNEPEEKEINVFKFC